MWKHLWPPLLHFPYSTLGSSFEYKEQAKYIWKIRLKRSADKDCHLLPYHFPQATSPLEGPRLGQNLFQTSSCHYSWKYFLCLPIQNRRITYSESCRLQLGNLKLHENKCYWLITLWNTAFSRKQFSDNHSNNEKNTPKNLNREAFV